jgi:hypothetical protein
MLRTDRLIRLYESDAAGMLDADLVDDVGWRLWERLSDVLRVNRGDVRCPACGTDLHGNCPAYAEFVDRFPTARTPKQRMMMIDAVVHELHLTAQGDPSNFAARNFIEGTRPKIVALLEELANGPGSTVAAGARERWEEARRRYRA